MTLQTSVEVKNKLGMHARPAMMLFELVQKFDARVVLRNAAGTEAEASSIIAMLMLESAQGGQISIQVDGPQEKEAMEAVVALFESGFDEEL
ncbi:MAG: PTS phosphocarrier protein NPr [Plesiomonas sp.]